MKNYTQLTEEERVKIFELRQLGHGVSLQPITCCNSSIEAMTSAGAASIIKA